MADGVYRSNPDVIIPYRKPADGSDHPTGRRAPFGNPGKVHEPTRAPTALAKSGITVDQQPQTALN